MEKTKMYQAVMITSSGVEILGVSNSKKQINEFLRDYIHRYIKDVFGWDDIEVLTRENCYIILQKNNNFIATFKIRSVASIIASPEELAEEKKERDKTAKNAE